MLINPRAQRAEFIFILVTILSVGALAIDIMLPAMPQIAADLGASDPNAQQLMVTYYMFGFGFSQLIYGPLSDSIGRKKALHIGLWLSLLPIALSPFAPEYNALLALRFIQGCGTGACRVLTPSIVRDMFEGREMAKIMSLTTMFYMITPMIAPSLGQLIIEFGTWHHTFFFLAAVALIALLWTGLRLPETLSEEHRKPFHLKPILMSFVEVAANKTARWYAFANMTIFATVIGFLGLSPQIYLDIYDLGRFYPLMIAFTATSIAIASLLNAKLVNHFDPDTIGVTANIGFILFAGIWTILAWQLGTIPFWLFVATHQSMMLCFGMIGSNQITVAMQPMGHIAGTASSTIGFAHSAGGAALGAAIGFFYNGTILPVAVGFLACGLGSLLFMRLGKPS